MPASMGSGRGDRNQGAEIHAETGLCLLQWGPVVVTGIREYWNGTRKYDPSLQWGPVVVTGISPAGTCGRWTKAKQLQWGPVVVTGISRDCGHPG